MIEYNYEEEYEEISDKEIRRFILKIALLVITLVVGVIAYGIKYCDFTPVVIIGFFTLPVLVEGVKLIWKGFKKELD